MNDVENILKNYVNAIDTAKTPQIVVAEVRSFVQFLKSHSLQPIIASLKEQKYSDLEKFQDAFAAFLEDKKKSFKSIEDFVKSTPFLEKRLSSDLFV